MSITIILSDDHKIVRDGLRSLLVRAPDIEVVGEAADGQATVDLVEELSPDVVVMDVTMPNSGGIEATRKILRKDDNVKIVALSMHPDKQFVGGMLGAGASAYLIKDCAFEELIDAIHAVMEGRVYLSSRIADGAIGDYMKHVRHEGPLTEREKRVLQLLVEDKTTEDIAALLDVNIRTVENHRLRIMKKLGTESLSKLTKHAIREGLTAPDA